MMQGFKILITLGGEKGVGKSTLANRLVDVLGKTYAVARHSPIKPAFSFGDPIKQVAEKLVRSALELDIAIEPLIIRESDGRTVAQTSITTALIDRFMYGDLKEFPIRALNGKSARDLFTGTADMVRAMNDSFFVRSTLNEVMIGLSSVNQVAIVDDLRHHIEFDTLIQQSDIMRRIGVIWIPVVLESEQTQPDLFNAHSSETEIAQIRKRLHPEFRLRVYHGNGSVDLFAAEILVRVSRAIAATQSGSINYLDESDRRLQQVA